MSILITGCAGFIGFHLAKKILESDSCVIGLDSLNDYYDIDLKKARLEILKQYPNFTFHKIDISNKEDVQALSSERFSIIINLAAQAGVQYSSVNPHAYIDSNLQGFLNILELSKACQIKHLIYASSSSVYGMNKEMPFKECHAVDHPISLYAATKRSNELMAHTYSHLFGIPTTGLRFFTVYGPWGRPDMALFKFTKSMILNEEIQINNHGDHFRDFTYIDDIVNGIVALLGAELPQVNDQHDLATDVSTAPWRILNIGRGQKVHLLDFIECIENYFSKEFKKEFRPLQPGDVPTTFSDTSALYNLTSYEPSISVAEGVRNFLDWYVSYYKIKLPL